jgi:putative Mg2+ transporter-C (MgtC) family protein
VDSLPPLATSPPTWIPLLQLDLLGRLVLAAVLGGIVGVEREVSGKPAGLRTNLLICVGSALFTELSIGVAALNGGPGPGADPGRIAAQVVTGIGFLGAGTILQSRGRVTGLTTAATVWVVAAIGMAVGARAYVEAVGTTVLVVLSLVLLVRLERLTRRHRLVTRRYTFRVDAGPDAVERLEAPFRTAGLRVRTTGLEKRGERQEVRVRVRGPAPRQERVVHDLLARPGVHRMIREG